MSPMLAALLATLAWTFLQAQGTPKCGNEGLICMDEFTRCQSGTCVCRRNSRGVAHMGCHSQYSSYCTITSDPRGKTFAREPVHGMKINAPCKTLFAQVETTRKDGRGGCKVRVFTFQQRFKGKFYVSGFEVRLKYTTRSGDADFDLAILRAEGKASNGVYEYHLQSSIDDYPLSSKQLNRIRASIPGQVRFMESITRKKVKLLVDHCGLEIFFRAADDQLGSQQEYLPGISMAINEYRHYTVYKRLEDSFCLSPHLNETSVAEQTAIVGAPTSSSAFIYRALTGPFRQNVFSLAYAECEAMQLVPAYCDTAAKRGKALEMCSFMMEYPHFVNCYSTIDSSADLILLLEFCLLAHCTEDTGLCNEVRGMITMKGCAGFIPNLPSGSSALACAL